ncbi:hypothetical protein HYU10_01250, partial [Candidatus Woesearchaeota archaeon]|nr:hypothetical protein [Candidatus Woesearchaeota archaeon]
TDSDFSIAIKAEDNIGNKLGDDAGTTLTKSLPEDDSIIVDSISVNSQAFVPDGRQFARSSGNEVKVVFTEAGNVRASDIRLSQAQITRNPICIRAAGSDGQPTGKTECTWTGVDLIEADLALSENTRDILGNTVGTGVNNKKISVRIDDVTPVVRNPETDIEVKGKTDTGGDPVNEIKIGNLFDIIARVQEAQGLKSAEVDFGEFDSGNAPVALACDQPDAQGVVTCTLPASSSVTVARGGQGDLVFTFEDNAGNTVTAGKAIKVFGTLAEGDIWTIENPLTDIVCSPENLDNEAAAVYPADRGGLPVDCAVKLKIHDRFAGDRTGLETLSINVKGGRCTSTPGELVESVHVTGNSPGSTEPILSFRLRPGQTLVDYAEQQTVAISCELEIFSRRGNEVNLAAEVEQFTKTFKVFSLREPATKLTGKIDKEKKKIKAVNDKIELVRGLLTFSERICSFFQTMIRLLVVLDTVVPYLEGVKNVLTATGFGAPLAAAIGTTQTSVCGSAQAGHVMDHTLIRGFGKFCAFVTCDETLWGNKLADVLDELPLVSDFGSATTTLDNALCVKGKVPGTNEECEVKEKGVEFDPPNNLKRLMNPDNSIVGSVLFGCIPGIVYNLEKYRQIECGYVTCLNGAVTQGGDPAECNRQRSHQICKHVVGELFSLLPYYQIANHFQDLVREALLDPFVLGPAALSLSCSQWCGPEDGKGWFYWSCQGLATFTEFSKVITTYQSAAGQIDNLNDKALFSEQAKEGNQCKDIEGI